MAYWVRIAASAQERSKKRAIEVGVFIDVLILLFTEINSPFYTLLKSYYSDHILSNNIIHVIRIGVLGFWG